jgi:ATP-dependent Lon protease
MGKASSKTPLVLPLIPLAAPLALLPGTTFKVPLSNRPDVAAILAKIYSVSSTARPDAAITVACVPLASTQLSRHGKLLIDEGPAKESQEAKAMDMSPVNATKDDIFGYGCLAKVSGVQGRMQGELNLLVEGLERVEIVDVLQERPYFEGELRSVHEHSEYSPKPLCPEYFANLYLQSMWATQSWWSSSIS